LVSSITLSVDVKAAFPDLTVSVTQISDVSVQTADSKLEEFKKFVTEETQRFYTAETLKDRPVLRAYRDFFWRIKVDPTKIRPAAEALIRRIVIGKPLPRINTLVDAYNLASVKTEVAVAAFDADKTRSLSGLICVTSFFNFCVSNQNHEDLSDLCDNRASVSLRLI